MDRSFRWYAKPTIPSGTFHECNDETLERIYSDRRFTCYL
jgi:hypothetical protein